MAHRFARIVVARTLGNVHMGMKVVTICIMVHFIASGLLLLLGVVVTTMVILTILPKGF